MEPLIYEENGIEWASVPAKFAGERFLGRREGMELDADGQILKDGVFVPGSENGWRMVSSHGPMMLFCRVKPSAAAEDTGSASRHYKVVSGDSFSSISKAWYGSKKSWMDIWRANSDVPGVGGPPDYVLIPGTMLTIPP